MSMAVMFMVLLVIFAMPFVGNFKMSVNRIIEANNINGNFPYKIPEGIDSS